MPAKSGSDSNNSSRDCWRLLARALTVGEDNDNAERIAMPMVSDAQLRQIAGTITGLESQVEEERMRVDAQRGKEKDEKKKTRAFMTRVAASAASIGGGALAGIWHGRREDADGNLFVPRTTFHADLSVGALGVGAALYMCAKKPDDPLSDVVLVGTNGFLAGAVALYFRKHTMAGKQANKFWAGVPELTGPLTHNSPSFGALPSALTVAQSMTDAELAASLRRAL